MFSLEVHQLIFEEKYKDFQRDAARYQLVKTALLRHPNNRGLVRRTVGWFGFQMVKWGSKLQHYNQGQHKTVTQHGS